MACVPLCHGEQPHDRLCTMYLFCPNILSSESVWSLFHMVLNACKALTHCSKSIDVCHLLATPATTSA
jgi:hypothetical protein